MSKTILMTGFTPFPGAPENPTSVLVEAALSGLFTAPDGVVLKPVLLPTEFEASWQVFRENLDAIKPDVIVQFGLSAKAQGFTLECIARNEITGATPDNSGYRADGGQIEQTAPLVLPTGLPLEEIYHALAAAGLPLEYSDSAGAYVCNHLFYKTMRLARSIRPARAGFIHIPYLTEQRDRLEAEGRIDKGLAAMSQAELFRGVEIILGMMAAA